MPVKISGLPAAGAALGTMQLEVNNGGTSQRVTIDQTLALTPFLIGSVDIAGQTQAIFTSIPSGFRNLILRVYGAANAGVSQRPSFYLSTTNGAAYGSVQPIVNASTAANKRFVYETKIISYSKIANAFSILAVGVDQDFATAAGLSVTVTPDTPNIVNALKFGDALGTTLFQSGTVEIYGER